MVKVKLWQIALVIAIITVLSEQFAAADDSDIINPKWKKPGWSRNRPPADVSSCVCEECECPPVPECPPVECSATKQTPAEEENNRLGLIYFRKFLNRLFDEAKLEDDEHSLFRLRNVQFKITDQQLSRLKEAKSAREIDMVVGGILEQSESGVYQSKAEILCWNFVAWYGAAMQSTIFLYVIVPAAAILLAYGIGRLLGQSVWILIPILGLGITYVLTYRDCNNQLELESLAKMMNTDGSNPCGKYRRSGWYFWEKNSEAECLEHLRVQYGMKRTFCDPSEILVQMVAKLHLQYFETFVLKMVSIFKTSTATSGPVETLLISGFILFVLYILMTVGIKYGLYAGGRFLADVFTRPWTAGQPALQGDARQVPAQVPPSAAPVNITMNIIQQRRTKSRVESTTNRIEDITEVAGEAPHLAGGLEALPAVGENSSRRDEDGSGDGPNAAVRNEPSDEGESSDDEMVMVQCDLADDASIDATGTKSTDKQSGTRVDQ